LWQRLVAWRPTLAVHPPLSVRASRLLAVQLGACAVLLGGALTWRLVRFGVDRSVYPVDAIAFMDQHDLQGRLVVTFNWAQYALAALSPTSSVGFDGRYDTCYPQAIVDMHFDLLFGADSTRRHRGANSGPIDPGRVLNVGRPDLVLLHRTGDEPGVTFVNDHPDWIPLYADGLAILWGRRSLFDNPDSARWFAPEKRQISDQRPQGRAAWPAFPGRSGRDAFSPDRAAEHAQRARPRVSKFEAPAVDL
jgi:hypothetical protein